MRLKRSLQLVSAAAGLLMLATVYAKPAPWYWWVSKVNGGRVCAQVMPSQGWTRGEGPFHNAQCSPQRGVLRAR